MMEDVKKLEEMVFEFFEVEIEFVFKEVNDQSFGEVFEVQFVGKEVENVSDESDEFKFVLESISFDVILLRNEK